MYAYKNRRKQDDKQTENAQTSRQPHRQTHTKASKHDTLTALIVFIRKEEDYTFK